MSPLPICPSPDSSTTNSEYFSGRVTPKMFITKAFSSMTSSPLSTHSFENDSPSPSANLPSSSSSSSSSQLSKDQEVMEVASTSGDSGVGDTNSDDVGSSCELASNDAHNDSVLKDSNSNGKEREEMIIEEEVTPSNIPMTL